MISKLNIIHFYCPKIQGWEVLFYTFWIHSIIPQIQLVKIYEWLQGLYQRRQWHPTPVLLPGQSHGWRSLVGWSPWGGEESDTTEWLHFHSSLSCIGEGNGNPLQCSCLENPGDGGAWLAAVYGVAQSRTQLKRLSSLAARTIYSPWISPGQTLEWVSLSLLPTQGMNPGLPHCRHILYQLSHKGSPRILECVAYPFSRGFSRSNIRTRVSCIVGGFFTNWAIREVSTNKKMLLKA